MIIELYEALLEAKVSDKSARKASDAIEKNLIDNSDKWKHNLYMEYINPLEKDRFGIRAEITILGQRIDNLAEIVKSNNEIMKYGFAEFEKKFQLQSDQMKFGFEQINKRFAFMEKLAFTAVGINFSLLIKLIFFSKI